MGVNRELIAVQINIFFGVNVQLRCNHTRDAADIAVCLNGSGVLTRDDATRTAISLAFRNVIHGLLRYLDQIFDRVLDRRHGGDNRLGGRVQVGVRAGCTIGHLSDAVVDDGQLTVHVVHGLLPLIPQRAGIRAQRIFNRAHMTVHLSEAVHGVAAVCSGVRIDGTCQIFQLLECVIGIAQCNLNLGIGLADSPLDVIGHELDGIDCVLHGLPRTFNTCGRINLTQIFQCADQIIQLILSRTAAEQNVRYGLAECCQLSQVILCTVQLINRLLNVILHLARRCVHLFGCGGDTVCQCVRYIHQVLTHLFELSIDFVQIARGLLNKGIGIPDETGQCMIDGLCRRVHIPDHNIRVLDRLGAC